MPAAKPEAIVSALMEAFRDSGAPALLVSSVRKNPRRFIAQTPEGNVNVWIYVWTLTHGGRSSLPDELRIQMTGVPSPLPKNPSGFTLLLGCHPDTGVFCGFDLDRHTHFTTGSPSVQVDVQCIHQALRDGLSFDRKSNQEIAVGPRSDHMMSYMANADELHRHGQESDLLPLLQRAAGLNDIADELSELRLSGGIDSFSAPLERKIHLPANRRQRPALSMIRKANRFRRIAVQ